MVEKMTKFSFILLSSDKEKFLSDLSALGVVDISRSSKPVDGESARILAEATEIKQRMSSLENETSEELVRLKEEAAAAKKQYTEAAPWGTFSAEALDNLRSEGLRLHFHAISSKRFSSGWENEIPLSVISAEGGMIYFVTVLRDGQTLPRELQSCEVAAPEMGAEALKAKWESLESECRSTLEQIREARKSELPALRKEYDRVMSRLDLYLAGAAGSSAAEDTLTVFVGFAAKSEESRLKAEFDKMDVVYLCEDAREDDNPPIKLHNNRYSREFERITGMYGMPVYGEVDPTPVISIFFLLFFAMCMGDAGYGILLILFGIAMNKKWIQVEMFSGLGTLISYLGVATLVVGLVMGSAFGMDLRQAGFMPDSLKSLMLPAKFPGTTYDYCMVLSLIIGIIHLCLAMTVKAVSFTKRFGLKTTISAWGWLILIVGGIAVGLLTLGKVVSPNATRWAIIIIGGISALAIFVFNTPGRNPLINIGAGLWDAYQMVTGVLGDVLSYIRLYALGLAGGMLGGAFNTLGMMVLGDGSIPKWIFCILVLLIGHVLNLLMSCLGAFVHPLRLNFLEYFKNSGFEGAGVKYNPLKNNN